MNAYMYHMLLRAREVWYKNRSRPMGADLISCPFCIADCANSLYLARKHMITHEIRCWSCPLLSTAHSHLHQLEMISNCETYGRELLERFENSAGPVPEEEIPC